jgi:hypothetical protein
MPFSSSLPQGECASSTSPKPSRPGVRLSFAPMRRRSPSTMSTSLLTAIASWVGDSISTQRRMPARISSGSRTGMFERVVSFIGWTRLAGS